MRVILIRHYKTQLNASGQIMGWEDSPPHEDWETDLSNVSKVLGDSGIQFDIIYSSKLDRARQTAIYHGRKLNIEQLEESEALNEVHYGQLHGKSKSWVAEHYPLHKKDPDFVYPQGESFTQMQRRCADFVLALSQKNPDSNVLLVAHSGVIRGLISHFLNLDYAANLNRQISHCYVGDFQLNGQSCSSYDEWGEPSGFITEKVIRVPV